MSEETKIVASKGNEPPTVDGKPLKKIDVKYQLGPVGRATRVGERGGSRAGARMIDNRDGKEVGKQLRRKSGGPSFESIVYGDSKTGVVRKFSRPFEHEGEEWKFFNDRVQSFELIWNNAKLAKAGFQETRLVGYYDYTAPSGRVFPQPVFEQKFLDPKDGWAIPTEKEISSHMEKQNYINVSATSGLKGIPWQHLGRWLHSDGSHIAGDINPDNVRINKNTGEVKIIDTVVIKPTDVHKEIAKDISLGKGARHYLEERWAQRRRAANGF